MSTDSLTKLILFIAFAGFLLVMVVNAIWHPGVMVPTMMTTVVGIVIGYAAHAQGVTTGGATAQAISDQTTQQVLTAQQPQQPPKDNASGTTTRNTTTGAP